MIPELDEQDIRTVAQAILDRIDGGLGWRVHKIRTPEHTFAEVGVGPAGAGEDDLYWGVYPLNVPRPDAIANLASNLQDHMIEATWGQALPACPGHTHPLNPDVIDGEALWLCPAEPGKHREPIA
ncbi:hypothetical protein [Microtetraspora malaysiensis]|uniref:Uncharacterized protein n=1 Tax=Microtetraspora malaysiensis TaxID=161358 RepID=A0ABW6T097_9ACTN